MGDTFDVNKKGSEEEYFYRKNQEAIQKIREKMRSAVEAQSTTSTSLQCPRCDGKLKTITFEEVDIDVCEKCSGIWLDPGEFGQLIKRGSGGWLGRLWGS